MLKNLERDLSYGMLRDAREKQFTQLCKQRRRKSQQSVPDDQCDRHDQQRACGVVSNIQSVDHVLEHDRDAQVGKFSGEQTGHGQCNAQLVFHQIGQQVTNNAPVASLTLNRRAIGIVRKFGGVAA